MPKVFFALIALFLSNVAAQAAVRTFHEEAGQAGLPASFHAIDWKSGAKNLTGAQVTALARGLGAKDKALASFNAGTFLLKDVNKDGLNDIVATDSRACADCPEGLVIIVQEKVGFILSAIDSRYALPAGDAVDLDKDGIAEILARSQAAGQKDAPFVPWIDIYRWNGKEYVQANKDFRNYYTSTYLPQRQATITRLRGYLKDIEDKQLRSYRDPKVRERETARINAQIAAQETAIARVKKEGLAE